jgi:hypothetical protein
MNCEKISCIIIRSSLVLLFASYFKPSDVVLVPNNKKKNNFFLDKRPDPFPRWEVSYPDPAK